MSFNQIKKSETLLKDKTGIPWICIYAARKEAGGAYKSYTTNIPSQELPIVTAFNTEAEFLAVMSSTTYGGANLTKFTYGSYYTSYNFTPGPGGGDITPIDIQQQATVSVSNGKVNNISFTGTTGSVYYRYNSKNDTKWENSNTTLVNQMKTAMGPVVEIASLNTDAYAGTNEVLFKNYYENYNGKYAKVGTHYYQMFVNVTDDTFSTTLPGGTVWNSFKNNMQQFYATTISAGQQDKVMKLEGTRRKLTFTYNLVNLSQLNVDININRNHLFDAPYDMFCLPYSDNVYLRIGNNGSHIRANKETSYRIANSLALDYGVGDNATIYDIQILPYCPIPEIETSTYNGLTELILIPTNTSIQQKYYSEIAEVTGSSSSIVGYIYHALNSSFTTLIDLSLSANNIKINNETDVYRLCSPNYNGIFEFSLAKNGGISGINVQCTYKPHTPYIKVFPIWGRLYGSGFGVGDFDARGLICGGDFSIPIVNSAWTNYQLQNKNYQIAFDRQIENLEFNNKYQRIAEQVNATVGTLGGAASGAAAGSVAGPWGAVIGGAVGGITSMVGGITDVYINDKLRNEALDYTKDQFGYQLGNIKALPQSLSKVSAFNIDNKYFPFLEYYTCSDEEKEALANKLVYNGMTVMTIGSISDYINNQWSYTLGAKQFNSKGYIKGKLIYITGLDGDYHIVKAIADELNKGAYFNV